jgi:hypothetical protein
VGVAEDVIAARGARCGLSSLASPSVSELAREFGLKDDPACYKEIDEPSARLLARRILHQDLAYNAELIPLARAEELASRFLDQFGPDARYLTNGSWHLPPVALADRVVQGPSWDPVTDATFDTGVLVLGSRCSGCLWVEDED